MNPKSKKVLADQGAGVVQALSWIGGAIFGDADDVLDEVAARGDAPAKAARPAPAMKPPRPVASMPAPRKRVPEPEPEIITVEGYEVEDEDQ